MAFTANINSWVYLAKYQKDGSWNGNFQNKEPYSPDQFARLSPAERDTVYEKRNSFPEIGLVSYTTQYGLSCFEGLKAYPQKNGGWKLFRPLESCKRMAHSMAGILQPAMPPEHLLDHIIELMQKTLQEGAGTEYDPQWAEDNFRKAASIYIRPFSHSEPGLGVSSSQYPWIIIVSTLVNNYFNTKNSNAMVTKRIRATPGGTGWIKCAANYVTSILAREEALQRNCMEAIFLDSRHHRYIEECSGCNLFFFLRDQKLVTPELNDTILAGITRDSVLQIARSRGIPVEERLISIEEVEAEAVECFTSGTASGIVPIHKIQRENGDITLPSSAIPETETLSYQFQKTLKEIQYGIVEDSFDWLTPISPTP